MRAGRPGGVTEVMLLVTGGWSSSGSRTGMRVVEVGGVVETAAWWPGALVGSGWAARCCGWRLRDWRWSGMGVRLRSDLQERKRRADRWL